MTSHDDFILDLLKFMLWVCIGLVIFDGLISITGIILGHEEGDPIMIYVSQYIGIIPTILIYMVAMPLALFLWYKLALKHKQLRWLILILFCVRASYNLYVNIDWIYTLVFA